jgi:hypothetical protein
MKLSTILAGLLLYPGLMLHAAGGSATFESLSILEPGQLPGGGLIQAGGTSCSNLTIENIAASITPATPAANYTVFAEWSADTPACYTIKQFTVTVSVVFSDGRSNNFTQVVPGTQKAIKREVRGLTPSVAPRELSVVVKGLAIADAAGIAGLPGVISVASDCPVKITPTMTKTEFAGLRPAPGRPGDFFPTVDVGWTIIKPTCVTLKDQELTVTLTQGGKQHTKTVKVAIGQLATTVIVNDVAVASTWGPDSVKSVLKVTGEARIEGSAQRKIRVQ